MCPVRWPTSATLHDFLQLTLSSLLKEVNEVEVDAVDAVNAVNEVGANFQVGKQDRASTVYPRWVERWR